MKNKRLHAARVLAISLYPFCLSAQPAQPLVTTERTSNTPSLSRVLPGRINSLIASAPPEIAAHALISIAERRGDLKPQERVFLYEEASARAATGQEVLPRHLLPGHSVDNMGGVIDAAADLGLDRLSLQCRAVRGTAVIDRQKALRMFLDIPVAQIKPLTCSDFLIPSVAVYYSTLGHLYSTSAAAGNDKRTQDLIQAISARALASNSILEVTDLFEVLPTLAVPFGDLVVILNGLTGSLATMTPDPRTLSAAMPRLQMGVLKIASTTGREGVDVKRLLVQLRGAARRSLDEPQCRGLNKGNVSVRYIVEPFNRMLSIYEKVLGESLAKTLRLQWPVDSANERYVDAELPEFWQSTAAKRLQRATRELKATSRNDVNSAQVSQVVDDIARWKAAKGESTLEVFHEASLLLYDLLKHPSLLDVRPAVASAFCGHLSSSDVLQSNPSQWLLHAKGLVSALERTDSGDGFMIGGCNTPALELVWAIEAQPGTSKSL